MRVEHTVVTCDYPECAAQVTHHGPAREVDGWLRGEGWAVSGARHHCPSHRGAQAPERPFIPAQREAADDIETRAAARAGDREAFGALAAEYRRTVYGYLRRRCGSHQLAEDLTQDTFARALKQVDRFQERGVAFGAWLVRIAANLLVDHYRAAHTRLSVAVDPGFSAALDGVDDCDPADEAAARDAAALLQVALRDLTDDQRTVIELRFFAGLSVAETAEKMGRNIGATKALQCRAVQALARHELLASLAPWAVMS